MKKFKAYGLWEVQNVKEFCHWGITYGIGLIKPFKDGGRFLQVDRTVTQIHQIIADGDDIIDIKAQSTRPMATRKSNFNAKCRERNIQ